MKKVISEVRIEIDHMSVFDDPNPVLISYAMKCVDKFIEFRLYGEDSHQYINDELKCLVIVSYKRGKILATIDVVRK